MAQIPFSLIKKIKIGRPEHLLTPHSLRPITSHFSLIPPPPYQSGRHMCITPKVNYWLLCDQFNDQFIACLILKV